MFARALVVAIALLVVTDVRADDPPTQDQLQTLADQKNWTELMKAATRVLQLKGPAAETYDRPQVWQLKAEAQLQTNMFVASAESFESAAEEPKVDPAVKDRCESLSLIMRKTDARGFRVKPAKPGAVAEPIDVKDPANRPTAMKALLDQEIAELKSELEKQKKKTSLNELVKIAQQARRLPPLERAATQSETQTDAIIAAAGSLMADSIGKWVEGTRPEIEKIRESANELVEVEGRRDRAPRDRRDPVYRKRGLTSKDVSDLKAITSECKRIAGAYKAFLDAAKKPGADLEAIPPRVDAIYKEAQNVLDADYS